MMRRLLALWEKECLALARDIHGLAVLFLMPAAFIVIMSLALSDAFKDAPGGQTEFAVLAADGASLAERFVQGLSGNGYRSVPAPADEAAARESVRRGKPALVLVVPRGFVRGLDASFGQGTVQPELALLADPALPPAQLLAFRQRILGVVLGLKVMAMTQRAGIPVDPAMFDLQQAAALRVEAVGNPRAGRPSSVQQNVPAWLIFGMFFVAMPIASLFIVERREGTLARLASQQVPFSMILLGKIGPFFAINLVQAALNLYDDTVTRRRLEALFAGFAAALRADTGGLAADAVATELRAAGVVR